MSGFETPLVVSIARGLGPKSVRLEAPLSFRPQDGPHLTVPPGFESDLVSSPSWSRPFVPRLEGSTAAPAVLHDWLYVTQPVTRGEADTLFFDALTANGVATWQRWAMFSAVRVGGSRAWARYAEHIRLNRTGGAAMTALGSSTPWLDIARGELGQHEIDGAQANPRIMEYFAAVPGSEWVKDDGTPWCGAFVAWVMTQDGRAIPKEALRARAWAEWGTPIKTPRRGAVAVFSRGNNPAQGHVTIVDEVLPGGWLECTGGNQSDSASKQRYHVSNLVPGGLRWPPNARVPVLPEAPRGTVPATTGLAAGAVAVGVAGEAAGGIVGDAAALPELAGLGLPDIALPDLSGALEFQNLIVSVMTLAESAISDPIVFAVAALVGLYWNKDKLGGMVSALIRRVTGGATAKKETTG